MSRLGYENQVVFMCMLYKLQLIELISDWDCREFISLSNHRHCIFNNLGVIL